MRLLETDIFCFCTPRVKALMESWLQPYNLGSFSWVTSPGFLWFLHALDQQILHASLLSAMHCDGCRVVAEQGPQRSSSGSPDPGKSDTLEAKYLDAFELERKAQPSGSEIETKCLLPHMSSWILLHLKSAPLLDFWDTWMKLAHFSLVSQSELGLSLATKAHLR